MSFNISLHVVRLQNILAKNKALDLRQTFAKESKAKFHIIYTFTSIKPSISSLIFVILWSTDLIPMIHIATYT
jgi:hypothetical protein